MHDNDSEFDFEVEASGSGSLEQAAKKVQKLRAELTECKAQRQEYLDGWQRMRADVANQKKVHEAAEERIRNRVRESMLEDLLPALDAFDMAMHSAGWGSVDAAWRAGVEYIHTQLTSMLEKHGVEPFGAVGDAYSPHLHEAVAEDGEPQSPQTIFEVRRNGYRTSEAVLRPAQVVVHPHKS